MIFSMEGYYAVIRGNKLCLRIFMVFLVVQSVGAGIFGYACHTDFTSPCGGSVSSSLTTQRRTVITAHTRDFVVS